MIHLLKCPKANGLNMNTSSKSSHGLHMALTTILDPKLCDNYPTS